MVHFIDESGNCLEDAKNFVLLSFAFDRLHELELCTFGQESAFRLNDEENDLDITIDVYLDFTCVLFEETVSLIVFKILKFLFISLKDVAELIQKVIYIETFADLSIE